MFLVCDDDNGGKSYQIWVNNKSKGFSLAQQGSLPSGVQAISFGDIDRDGTIDIIFATCDSVSSSTGVGTKCAINIAFNQQLPLCTAATDSGFKNGVQTCRPPEDLCTADPSFHFNMNSSNDNDAFVTISLSTLFPGSPSSSLLVFDTTYQPPLPVPIKVGDANLDGFPDLLIIAALDSARTPKLVFSVPCANAVAGCAKGAKIRRGWKIVTKDVESLEAIQDARSVAFLDMDEDVRLAFPAVPFSWLTLF